MSNLYFLVILLIFNISASDYYNTKSRANQNNANTVCFYRAPKYQRTSGYEFVMTSTQNTSFIPNNQSRFMKEAFCNHSHFAKNRICHIIKADSIDMLFESINTDDIACNYNKAEREFHVQLNNGFSLPNVTIVKNLHLIHHVVRYMCLRNTSLGSDKLTNSSSLYNLPTDSQHPHDTHNSLCENHAYSGFPSSINKSLLISIKPHTMSFTLKLGKNANFQKAKLKLYSVKQEIIKKNNKFPNNTPLEMAYNPVILNDFHKLCRIFEIDASQCVCYHFILLMPDKFKMRLCYISTIIIESTGSNLRIKNFCVHYLVNRDFNIKSNDVCSLNVKSTSKSFEPFDLEILCEAFNVTGSDCTCEKFKIGNLTLCEQKNQIETVLEYIPYFHRVYASISSLAALLGIIGNSLVLIVAFQKREGLSKCKILFAQLAFCDWIFALIILIKSVHLFWTPAWPFGIVLCKIMEPSMDLGAGVAIGIITIISIERYIGIVKPFQRGIPISTLHVSTLSNIIVSVGIVIPTVIYMEVSAETSLCRALWPKQIFSLIYNIILLLFYFLLPLFVISCLYLLIINTLQKSTIVLINKDSTVADPRMREKRRRENKKTICMLSMVVISFVLFILPKRMILLYYDVMGWASSEIIGPDKMALGTYYATIYIAYIPYPCHVAINPIIYSFMDVKWRNEIKELFGMRNKRQRKNTITMTSSCRRRRSSPAVLKMSTLDNKYEFDNHSKQLSPDPFYFEIGDSSHSYDVTKKSYSKTITMESIDIPRGYKTNTQKMSETSKTNTQKMSETSKSSIDAGPSQTQKDRRQKYIASSNDSSIESDLSTTYGMKRNKFSDSSNMTSIESDLSPNDVAKRHKYSESSNMTSVDSDDAFQTHGIKLQKYSESLNTASVECEISPYESKQRFVY